MTFRYISIRLYEPPRRRVVPPGPVIIQSDRALQPLPGKMERRRCGAARIPLRPPWVIPYLRAQPPAAARRDRRTA